MLHIDPTLLPAVFGLIGVIVGGLITAGVDYFLEERRAYRDETKERRKRLTDLKRAARLMREDFTWAWASMGLAILMKRWPDPRGDAVRLQSWREYRSVLAAETTLADWEKLQSAVRAMETYQATATDCIGRNEWDITPEGLRYRQSEREAVEKGRAALTPFLDIPID